MISPNQRILGAKLTCPPAIFVPFWTVVISGTRRTVGDACGLYIYAADSGADAAEDVVRDGSRDAGDLVGVQAGVAFLSKECDFISGGEIGVAEVNGGQVHRDGAEDGRQLSGGDDLAPVGKAVEHAIRITGAENADAH